jgi:hypothetical protein
VPALWGGRPVLAAPRPIAPSDSMTSLSVFLVHRDRLMAQRDSLGVPAGAWVAGHKKDVVITSTLFDKEGRVAIYGWHRENGSPIQPLYTGHGDSWVDYSHGIRLVSRRIRIDGVEHDLADLLTDPALAALVHPAGPLPGVRYTVR